MSKFIRLIQEQEFDAAIEKDPTLVDFYADWCGPCRMLTPHLEKVAQEMAGKVSVVKVDVETASQVASRYRVTSIPTLILFKDKKELTRVVGVKDATALKELLTQALAGTPS